MNWHLKSKAPEEFLKQFPEYPPLVLHLLYDRDLINQKEIDEFFNPDYGADLHDPFLMKDMKRAVLRLQKAAKAKEEIVIFADYDCDGVCGAVILETILKIIGANLLDVYMPDRSKEGYGLNMKAIQELKNRGVKVILTIDCGITDDEEIKFAKSLGIETIVIDHHQVVKKIPQTIVVDPWQKGDKYPFKELSGAGVAFKLGQALIRELGTGNWKLGMPEGGEKWLLDLVALATVADCMPLLGENRTLVKYGLIVLAQTQRIGLQALMKVAGLSPNLEKIQDPISGIWSLSSNLDTYTLGFVLAPRLNVASRLDHANLAYQLLTTESEEEAQTISQRLNQINKERQQIVDKIIKEIDAKLSAAFLPKLIFEASAQWPVGVGGLVASKLNDKYHRPTLIFNIDGDRAKGSARSIPSFDITKAISSCSQFLEEFGGHPQAAGCNLLVKNLDNFKNCLTNLAEKEIKEEDLVPVLEIDCQVESEEINWSIYDQLQKFAPFGVANHRPLFLVSDLEIFDLRIVGNNNKHLKLELGTSSKKIKAIGFNLVNQSDGLKIGDKCDIVFELLVDEWNGTRDLQMKVVDFKKK